MAKVWLMVLRSTADFPGRYAPMVSSRKSRRSRSCASESPTILSRWESSAWRIEIGRLSVELGLSRRVCPVTSFRSFGRILHARMIGISLSRDVAHAGCIRVRRLRVKFRYLALLGGVLYCLCIGVRSREKLGGLAGSVGWGFLKWNGHAAWDVRLVVVYLCLIVLRCCCPIVWAYMMCCWVDDGIVCAWGW